MDHVLDRRDDQERLLDPMQALPRLDVARPDHPFGARARRGSAGARRRGARLREPQVLLDGATMGRCFVARYLPELLVDRLLGGRRTGDADRAPADFESDPTLPQLAKDPLAHIVWRAVVAPKIGDEQGERRGCNDAGADGEVAEPL